MLSNSAGWIVAGVVKPSSLGKEEKINTDFLKQRKHTNMKRYNSTEYQPEHYNPKQNTINGNENLETLSFFFEQVEQGIAESL